MSSNPDQRRSGYEARIEKSRQALADALRKIPGNEYYTPVALEDAVGFSVNMIEAFIEQRSEKDDLEESFRDLAQRLTDALEASRQNTDFLRAAINEVPEWEGFEGTAASTVGAAANIIHRYRDILKTVEDESNDGPITSQWCVLHRCHQDDPDHSYQRHLCENMLRPSTAEEDLAVLHKIGPFQAASAGQGIHFLTRAPRQGVAQKPEEDHEQFMYPRTCTCTRTVPSDPDTRETDDACPTHGRKPPVESRCRCWNEGEWGRVHREDCPVHKDDVSDIKERDTESARTFVLKAIGSIAKSREIAQRRFGVTHDDRIDEEVKELRMALDYVTYALGLTIGDIDWHQTKGDS